MTDTQSTVEPPLEYFRSRAKDLGVEHLTRGAWQINYIVPNGMAPLRPEAQNLVYMIKRGSLGLEEVRIPHETLNGLLRKDINGPLGVKSQELGFGYEVVFRSFNSDSGIHVLSGEGIESRLDISELPGYENSVPGNVKLADPTRVFYFAIDGLDILKPRPNVEFRVKDLAIASARVGEGFVAPKEFFELGGDYKPAVNWILERYASAMKIRQSTFGSIPGFGLPKKQW